MKVKKLIELLKGLDQEKEIMIDSDQAFINSESIVERKDFYCIYGDDNG